MISPAGGLRIYVATRPTDFRKGIDGLALVVQETMGLDPFSGAAFVFRAKRADRIKLFEGLDWRLVRPEAVRRPARAG